MRSQLNACSSEQISNFSSWRGKFKHKDYPFDGKSYTMLNILLVRQKEKEKVKERSSGLCGIPILYCFLLFQAIKILQKSAW